MDAGKPYRREMSESYAIRAIVGANLSALMAARLDLASNIKVAEKTSLGTGTIARIRNGEVGCSIDTLDVLAKAFDVYAWQLLVPGLESSNPPVLQPVTASERELYEKIQALVRERATNGD